MDGILKCGNTNERSLAALSYSAFFLSPAGICSILQMKFRIFLELGFWAFLEMKGLNKMKRENLQTVYHPVSSDPTS